MWREQQLYRLVFCRMLKLEPVAEIRSDGARVRRRRAERSVGSGVRDTKLS